MTTLEIIGMIVLFILTIGGLLGTLIYRESSHLWYRCYKMELKASREYFAKYINLLNPPDKEVKKW